MPCHAGERAGRRLTRGLLLARLSHWSPRLGWRAGTWALTSRQEKRETRRLHCAELDWTVVGFV
jgi:hypothetical protein